jgi:hypothetical protein
LAVAVRLFGAETMRIAGANMDQGGERFVKFFPEMTSNQELDAVRKCAPESPLDEAITVVQKRFPKLRVGQFPPLVKKGKLRDCNGKETDETHEIPDGIIAHLTMECAGIVHDRHVVEVKCGSFEKETTGANPHSGVLNNDPKWAAKNSVEMETDSRFHSAYCKKEEDIPHTRNNWLCYDFRERRIVPTHCTIRTNWWHGPGCLHLKSWLVETSLDGKVWREVAREEDNDQLNGKFFTGTFAVADGGECRFIRPVNIGRNHNGDDCFFISAWEIFGSLIE